MKVQTLQEKLDKHVERWRQLVSAPQLSPTNVQMAEDAAKQIYLRYKTQSPGAVIWCDSPYQLAVIPALVTNILDGPGTENWRTVIRKLNAAGTPGSAEWEGAWLTAWEDLRTNYIEPMAPEIMTHSRLRGTKDIVRIRSIRALEKPLHDIALRNRIQAGDVLPEKNRKRFQKHGQKYISSAYLLDWTFSKAAFSINNRVEQEAGLELQFLNVYTYLAPFHGIWDKRLITKIIPASETLLGPAQPKKHPGGLTLQIKVLKDKCQELETLYMRESGFWSNLVFEPRRVRPLDLRPEAGMMQNTISAFGQIIERQFDQKEQAKEPPMVAGTLACWLPHFLPWVPFALGCRYLDQDPLANLSTEIDDWGYLCRGALACFPTDKILYLCKKPLQFNMNASGQVHNENGPATTWEDGYETYAWRGITVPENFIMHPERISHQEITNEVNAEIRRVMIDRYGDKRYLQDAGAKIVSEDETGILYRMELPGDEPIVMVKVKNSTPEPDGTYKHYYLRVPPNIVTAKQAVAWTFGLAENEYKPDLQS